MQTGTFGSGSPSLGGGFSGVQGTGYASSRPNRGTGKNPPPFGLPDPGPDTQYGRDHGYPSGQPSGSPMAPQAGGYGQQPQYGQSQGMSQQPATQYGSPQAASYGYGSQGGQQYNNPWGRDGSEENHDYTEKYRSGNQGMSQPPATQYGGQQTSSYGQGQSGSPGGYDPWAGQQQQQQYGSQGNQQQSSDAYPIGGWDGSRIPPVNYGGGQQGGAAPAVYGSQGQQQSSGNQGGQSSQQDEDPDAVGGFNSVQNNDGYGSGGNEGGGQWNDFADWMGAGNSGRSHGNLTNFDHTIPRQQDLVRDGNGFWQYRNR